MRYPHENCCCKECLEVEQIRDTAGDMLAALELCVKFMPGAEIRNWPPGWKLRDDAMVAAKTAIKKAKRMQSDIPQPIDLGGEG